MCVRTVFNNFSILTIDSKCSKYYLSEIKESWGWVNSERESRIEEKEKDDSKTDHIT